MVALNPDFLTPHFLRTPQTAPPSGGAGLPATTAHAQALPLPAPTPAGLGPEELHGPLWWPWVLRPPLGAQGRERERGLSEERPPPFSAVGSMVCSQEARPCPEEAFPEPGGEGALQADLASPTHVGLSVSMRCWFSF